MKTLEMKLKQTQNATKLSLKPTLKNKRNRTKKNHRKGGHLQRKNGLTWETRLAEGWALLTCLEQPPKM
jgi:hypothetical protein